MDGLRGGADCQRLTSSRSCRDFQAKVAPPGAQGDRRFLLRPSVPPFPRSRRSRRAMDEFTEEIRQRLLAPFDAAEVETRPGDGGKRFAFVDARAVMKRLDEAVGPAGWSFTYEVVRCDDAV